MTLQTDHHPAWADSPRARLEPVWRHHMVFDGRWWPRSGDPGAELPALVRILDDSRGPVVRLLLSAAGWSRRPHHVVVAGRVVTIGYFSGKSQTMLTAIHADGSVLTLLVEPVPSAVESGRAGGEEAWEGEGGHLAAPRHGAVR
jgi:hypothetical protein